jgi:L-ascorbate metabolism protein UlaG (beta-lactamase superfamily)
MLIKKDLEELTARLGWDATESTHAALLTAFDGTTAVSFSIADPSSNETITFEGHVRQIQRYSPAEDTFEVDVAIQPTGAPTIT